MKEAMFVLLVSSANLDSFVIVLVEDRVATDASRVNWFAVSSVND
jgi:hypothetical protein